MTPKFQIPVSDWEEVKIENAKFVLTEAQTYAKDLSEASGHITARAFSILTIFIPITSALIAFVVGESMKGNPNYFITFYIIVIVTSLIVIMFFLGKLVLPRLFMPLGRQPAAICSDEMLGVKLTKELSIIAIVLNEIEDCQQKIEYNECQNNQRIKMLERIMKAGGVLFAIAIITIAVYLLTLV